MKVVQLMYAYYQNEGASLQKALKELDNSLMDAYKLYCYMLLIIPEVTDFARDVYETACEQARTLGRRELPSSKFVDNRLAAALEENEDLRKFSENRKNHQWSEVAEEIRSLYKKIIGTEEYQTYINSAENSMEEDRSLWMALYRKCIQDNEELEDFLEQWSIYWNDDKPIVDTFVMKTLRNIDNEKGTGIMPAYDTDEDHQYALQLFEDALLNRTEYENMIARNTRNWDFKRLPLMDVVIMVIAIAEIMTIPKIDVKVSINEYLNLLKDYGDPKSVGYVNGILDSVIDQMRKEGRIAK